MSKARPKLLVFDTKPYDREFLEKANERYEFDIKFIKPRLNAETMALAHDVNTVCAFVNDDVSATVARTLYENGVKLIALRSAGYNNVDLDAVYRRIHVVRVPEYSPHAVAEHTMALILTLNRKTHKAYSRTRDSNFSIEGLLGFDLYGKCIGIIGTGRIGRVMIGICKGFGMNVIAYDPYPDRDAEKKLGFEYVSLSDLYAQSGIISLHCPLTPENIYMINEKAIAAMKPGVMIINTGRGKLINTADLIEGLKDERIGAAGLDVYEEEDAFFFEDLSATVLTDDVLARMLTFPNVIITAHQAFFTREALTNIAETTLYNIAQYFEHDSLPHEICYKCSNQQCQRKETGKCF
jgi:D-lactate dehydrogenase